MIDVVKVRVEIGRLSNLLLRKSAEYGAREEYIRGQHGKGSHNFQGDIDTVLKNDLRLKDISGASKTISAMLAAHAASLSAEVAWLEFRRGIAAAERAGVVINDTAGAAVQGRFTPTPRMPRARG